MHTFGLLCFTLALIVSVHVLQRRFITSCRTASRVVKPRRISLKFVGENNQAHLRDDHVHDSWEVQFVPFVMYYNDVTMDSMASQILSITNVYSAVYSGADQRKHQSSASLAFVRGIHRGPVNSPHKWPVKLKMFPFDDIIMKTYFSLHKTFATQGAGAWGNLADHDIKPKYSKIVFIHDIHLSCPFVLNDSEHSVISIDVLCVQYRLRGTKSMMSKRDFTGFQLK